jgi:hypothetical protein
MEPEYEVLGVRRPKLNVRHSTQTTRSGRDCVSRSHSADPTGEATRSSFRRSQTGAVRSRDVCTDLSENQSQPSFGGPVFADLSDAQQSDPPIDIAS